MAVAGLRGTGDWGTDERPKNFRDIVLRRNPNGSAPIFALTSKAGKRSVDDPEFAWWDEANDIVRLQVNGALASGDTLITVDSADPTVNTMSSVYGSALNLKPGDLLLVDKATETTTFDNELVEVTGIVSEFQFQVRRGAGNTTPASIGDDAFLTLIGSAYAEGTGIPRATSRNPLKFKNYTQIFKDTYELTATAVETRLRTGDPWSNDKRRKMWDHSRAIEMALLFGRQYETVGENGKPKRYMGGLRQFIPAANTKIYSTATTPNSLIDAIAPVFDFNTEGAGDTRIAFGGRAALAEIAKSVAALSNAQFNFGTTVTVYGMAFKELIMPDGRLLLKSHPLMSRHGKLKNSLFVLDFSAIKYVYMKNRDTKSKDDVQAKDEDVRRGFWQTECSLEVDAGGLTQAYIGNISAT